MTELDKLVAVDAIKRLMARRIRALDTQDWVTYSACHAEDHTSHGPQFNPGEGRASMMQAVTRSLAGVSSIHLVHSPMIEIMSSTEAKGYWTLEDRLYWKQGIDDHWFHGWGYYDDTYGIRGGEWLFTSRRLSYLRKEHSSGSRRAHEA